MLFFVLGGVILYYINDEVKEKFEPLKKEILKEVNNDYKEIVSDGLYLASKFYIDTPRKMKKFANEFVNEVYNHMNIILIEFIILLY